MKHFIPFLFLLFGLTISSMAQKSDKKQNLPRENSKVTREYDEKGNLIRFDSVYSYSYSSDSTLLKNFSPKGFPDFSFFSDSVSEGNSFFDGFDKMFADPFSPFDQKQDSIFRKQFEGISPFQGSNNDSTTFSSNSFDDLFGHFFESGKDSSSVKRQDKIAGKSQRQTMDDVMQMFRGQVQEMEKRQREFFEGNQKFKEF
jgi:hypothetical protein